MAPSSYRTLHRQMWVIAGEAPWARQTAMSYLAPYPRRLWVGASAPSGESMLAAHQARQWLGRELDALVFDAHCGFDPDAFGAIAGTVVGGGVLMLLTPPLAQWPVFPDPDKVRIAQHPYTPGQVGGRFLYRLAEVIRADPALFLIEQGAASPPILPLPVHRIDTQVPISLTTDQTTAVEALLRVATGHGRRPLLLISDRGRGKSTALGIAAVRLLQSRPGSRVLVTAPAKSSTQTLFQQVKRLLGTDGCQEDLIPSGPGEVRFLPPDELIRHPQEADLLLVDEAAAIPLPLLERLLTRYNRVAFATTEHGYEGAGRGFSLCFPQLLNRHAPHWHQIHLRTPVRWAEGDPVEAFGLRALLLDAETADSALIQEAHAGDCLPERLDPDRLAGDEAMLSEVFGLLVQAHYQTRPSDLRRLLDGPETTLWVSRNRGRVVGVLLAIDEGGFDPPLAEAIWQGERRPRGHLIPQTLSAHAGFREAAVLRYRRITRLAVHPVVQGRGIGSGLVLAAVDEADRLRLDFVGSSFGATTELLDFWERLGLAPVRVGVGREAASGRHSVIVLRPLTPTASTLFHRLRARFHEGLPLLLADPLQGLEPDIALALLRGASVEVLSEQDRLDLEAFSRGRRDYAGARLALWRLSCRTAARGADWQALRPLVVKVLQGRNWGDAAFELGLSGKRAVEEALRQAAGALMVRDGASPLPKAIGQHPAGIGRGEDAQ